MIKTDADEIQDILDTIARLVTVGVRYPKVAISPRQGMALLKAVHALRGQPNG